MDSQEFLLHLTTPHKLKKSLDEIQKESTLPNGFKDELINIVKSVAKGAKQAKEKGLIFNEELEKLYNSNKS